MWHCSADDVHDAYNAHRLAVIAVQDLVESS